MHNVRGRIQLKVHIDCQIQTVKSDLNKQQITDSYKYIKRERQGRKRVTIRKSNRLQSGKNLKRPKQKKGGSS